MTAYTITAEVRTGTEKTSQIRSSKRVPGVVYGKTQEPISFSVDASDLLRLYRKAGESSIIDLKVGKVELEVLVHQTQKHPVTGQFTHIDFYAITRWEKLTTKVQVNFVGESAAVREGAIIEEIIREIEVSCLPRDLIDHFDADLTLLAVEGDAIRVSDLKINTEKYDITLDLEDTVATAAMPRAIVEEDPIEAEWAEAEWEEAKESEGEEKAAE